MKKSRNFSIFGDRGKSAAQPTSDSEGKTGLTGSELEEAYRDLLLQNQVLVESNQRLNDRLAQIETDPPTDSPATRQLIRAQRDAIAERSHALRDQQYAHKTLQREHQRLIDDNRRLTGKLARKTSKYVALKKLAQDSEREAESLKQQLTEARRELAMLRDRYYQLQSRVDPALSADRVVNGDF